MENCEASGTGGSWAQGAAFAHGNGLPEELPGITRAVFLFIIPLLKGGHEGMQGQMLGCPSLVFWCFTAGCVTPCVSARAFSVLGQTF